MRVVGALLLACLLVAAPHARAEEEVDEKDVVVLTDANIKETLGKHKYALVSRRAAPHQCPRSPRTQGPPALTPSPPRVQVEFYAPWCGHCKVRARPPAAAAWPGSASAWPAWRWPAPHGPARLRGAPLQLGAPCSPPRPSPAPSPQSLKPEYAAAATQLAAHDASILIAKVDVTVEKEAGTTYGVKSFPTLKWFVDGEVAMDYSSGRTA